MLLLCITGLPLIFHDEINQLIHRHDETARVEGDKKPRLSAIVEQAKEEHPSWEVMFLTWDTDEPTVSVILGPTMTASESDVAIISFDTRSGERLRKPPVNEGIMFLLLEIHGSLLMGLPGALFLGVMGLMLVISLVSGIIVYMPFMRRLSFGTVRRHRSRRVKWLDIHNLTGIVTLSWVLVVGFTGVVLTLVTPLTALWQSNQLAKFGEAFNKAEPHYAKVSPDAAIASVKQQIPSASVSFISWPNSPYATPYHYTVAIRGNTPLTQYLLTMALVDAQTGELSAVEQTPWYLSAVNLSIPLHFGDYGGLPLKVIWALLDIAAICVLWSGLYLWWRRHKQGIGKRVLDAHSTGY